MAKFDLAQTQELTRLFTVPREERLDTWQQQLYAAAPDATLMCFDPQVSRGPDTFPYFDLAIPDPGPVTPFCITHLLDFLLENGLGCVIWGSSKREGPPEWVFTYGDLLSYSMFGRFEGPMAQGGSPPEYVKEARQVLVAAPNESFLPTVARKAIGNFVRENYRHPDPKVGLVVDASRDPSQILVINLALEQYQGDQHKLDMAMRYLFWFLPRGYTIMALPAGWSDADFAKLG